MIIGEDDEDIKKLKLEYFVAIEEEKDAASKASQLKQELIDLGVPEEDLDS